MGPFPPDNTDQVLLTEYIRSVVGGFSDYELATHVCGRAWNVTPVIGVDVTTTPEANALYEAYVQAGQVIN